MQEANYKYVCNFFCYKEGENYLERSWGPEKLKKAREFAGILSNTAPTTSTSNSHDDIEPPAKRPKLAKHTTMMNTTKVRIHLFLRRIFFFIRSYKICFQLKKRKVKLY